jgi:SRSO17 transposase
LGQCSTRGCPVEEADGLVGDEAGFLVIDDTALPKKGRHSVGVAPQYASWLGKTANCQSLVSVTLASREVPVMVGLRLFLPESWTDDPERMARAGVPKDRQTALTKTAIAIEEIDRVIASGARFGCVLAESGYGSSGSFRQALSERGVGGGSVATPERLSRRRCPDLPRREGRKAPQIPHP